MEEPGHKKCLFAELRRRKVFRSAGAYIVVAWVIIQVASIVFPEFRAPEWAMRALIIGLIAGFPPAMLAAWTIDVSRSGIERTSDSRFSRAQGAWPAVAVTLAATGMSAVALFFFWDELVVQEASRIERSAIKERPVIAVAAPRQITGNVSDEWLGDGIANLIRSDLAESQHVVVVSPARTRTLASGATGDPGGQADQWEDSGIDYLVDGQILNTPGGIVLTTVLEDLDTGVQIVSPRITGKDSAEIIDRVPQLSTEIKRALHIPHVERVGLFEADFATDNIAAYETYIAGLDYHIDFDYESAEEAFKRVLEIAPDYHIARFRLALVYELTGRPQLAKATLDEIPTDAGLSRRLRLYVEGARAWFVADRDIEKAIDIYEELVEAYPYEMEASTLLGESYWLDFQDDAAIAEFRRMLEIHPYEPTAWMALGERLLDLGELDEARRLIERYAEMAPEDPYAYALLGNLAVFQGEIPVSIERHQQALERDASFAFARLGLARALYLNDDFETATLTWQSLIDDESVAPGYRIDAAFDLSRVLRGRGRFGDSITPIESLMPLIKEESFRVPLALSETGLSYLDLGEVDTARERVQQAVQLASQPTARYLFARGQFELEIEDYNNLRETIAELDAMPGLEDARGKKAASYLSGIAALNEGVESDAKSLLESAVSEEGYNYSLYELGLAQYLAASGEFERAAEVARVASEQRDAGDLRLDLEKDRAIALLYTAEFNASNEQPADAAEQARRFLTLWKDAPADRPELARAKQLAGQP